MIFLHTFFFSFFVNKKNNNEICKTEHRIYGAHLLNLQEKEINEKIVYRNKEMLRY